MFIRRDKNTGRRFVRKGRVGMAIVCLALAVFEGGTVFWSFAILWGVQIQWITWLANDEQPLLAGCGFLWKIWVKLCALWMSTDVASFSSSEKKLSGKAVGSAWFEAVDAEEEFDFLAMHDLTDLRNPNGYFHPASPLYLMKDLHSTSSPVGYGVIDCNGACSGALESAIREDLFQEIDLGLEMNSDFGVGDHL